jgi:hypothetical protein
MDALSFIVKKFDLDLKQASPIQILNINRRIMAETLNQLGFKKGAEIGTAKGDHAKILCEKISGLKLYCINPWEEYSGYSDYTASELAAYYNEAKQKLGPYDVVLMKKFSMDAVRDFPDESLDFVYIDGADDFKNVAMDVCERFSM